MKPTIAYLGCDPGLSGGLAVIFQSPAVAPFTLKMPETERDLWDSLVDIGRLAETVVAAVERVSSSPQMGVTSAFTFGRGYGALRMALIGAGLAFVDVQPQAWQKALGCRTGGDKNVSKSKAQQMFPGVKCTHAISDALLIAEWRRRQP